MTEEEIISYGEGISLPANKVLLFADRQIAALEKSLAEARALKRAAQSAIKKKMAENQ